MASYRVIGIDPALRNTGLCVLESDGPGRYTVTASKTLKTDDQRPMLARLDSLRLGTQDFLRQHGFLSATPVILEDPSAQATAATHRQRPRNICVMGMAIGGVAAAVLEWSESQAYFIETSEWMPKIKSGNFEHIMPKASLTRYIMGQITFPVGVSEHVIMSAGLARYWIERERMRERKAAAG